MGDDEGGGGGKSVLEGVEGGDGVRGSGYGKGWVVLVRAVRGWARRA